MNRMGVKPWRWAVPKAKGKDNLGIMLQVKETIDDYPPYKARFRLTDILENGRESAPDSRKLTLYFGAWPVPDRFTHHRNNHYVNPNYKDLRIYSDSAVECECGAWMVHGKVPKTARSWTVDHAEDCTPENRKKARERLHERRRELIRRSFSEAMLPGEQVAKRVGLQSHRQLATYCYRDDELGSITDMQRVGRKRITATWNELMERGRTTNEIADAFGVSESQIWVYKNRYDIQ